MVRLSAEEREKLNRLIRVGKHPARKLLKARIPLKADASELGEGWSDSKTAAALETSVDTVARTRQELVDGGLEAALTRKHSPYSVRPRIFGGAAEAKLIALACSPPPKGARTAGGETARNGGGGAGDCRARQRQYDRADAKKMSSSRICRNNG